MTETITVPVDEHRECFAAKLEKIFTGYGFIAMIAPRFMASLGSIWNAYCRWPPSGFLYSFGTYMSIRLFNSSWLELLCLACIAWRGAESEISSRVQPSFRGIPQGFTSLFIISG